MTNIIDNIKIFDYKPQFTDFKSEVINGLTSQPKVLPPKLFYDERGSKLFEDIVKLEEYYIPSIEKQILKDNIDSIIDLIGKDITIIEPGSGSCEKVQILLDAHKNVKSYIPIEISADFLSNVIKPISSKYSDLMFYAIAVDYLNNFTLPNEIISESKNNLVFFPGSSIGNYNHEEAINILKVFHKIAGFNSKLLIGVDMVKDKKVLELAYDDSKGITAEFNLNLIERINKELKVNINKNDFIHEAIYNTELNRIEMYLISNKYHEFYIDNNKIILENREKIHTENSYKYTDEKFIFLAQEAGYKFVNKWKDKKEYFSIYLFQS